MTTQFKRRVTVKNYRKVENGIDERLPDTTHAVIIEIDLDRVAQELGTKAIRSRGRRVQEASGLLVVKALSQPIIP